MARYLITYLGGDRPSTPEEGKAHFARYQKWLASLGDAVVSPMNPFRATSTVAPNGSVSEGSSVAMSGYTVVEAESMDAAVDMVKACPFLEINGTLEVSEVADMQDGN